MYKIAHISDTHISYSDDIKQTGKKLIDVLRDIKKRECDHIVITGDLADNPVLEDFLYIKEILSHFELLDSGRLTVVPGNHDIFGGAPNGKMFFTFPLTCKEIDYDEKLNLFIDTFKETFPSNNSYPFSKVIGNTAFIGINSVDAWSEDKNPEGSNGRISKEDFAKVKKLLSSPEIKDKYKIILIHHYFNKMKVTEEYPAHTLWLKVVNRKMKLYGKKELEKLFKKSKVSLVLHGHSHVNSIYNIEKVTYVNGSACCLPLTDDQLRMYNIISIPDDNDTETNINIDTITLSHDV